MIYPGSEAHRLNICSVTNRAPVATVENKTTGIKKLPHIFEWIYPLGNNYKLEGDDTVNTVTLPMINETICH